MIIIQTMGQMFTLFRLKIVEIHHRQPVILNQTDINRYLDIELQGSAFLKEREITDLFS